MSRLQHENKVAAYAEIKTAMVGLLSGPLVHESALVSLIALIKEKLTCVSWVGFYRNYDGQLWVSAYQGPLACVSIRMGQGVCGAAAAKRETVIVEDVHEFAGHIACDALAASEIVVPVVVGGALLGVLDLDSHEKAAFAAVDREALEALVKSIEHLALKSHNL